MDRRTILWTLVAFFGASLLFATANNLLRDESAALRLGVQVALLALLVGAILLAVRRSGR